MGRFWKWKEDAIKDIPFSTEEIKTIDYKAELAKEVLGNPMLHEVFERIEDQLVTLWKNTNPSETEAREIAYYRLEAIRKVQNMIKGYLNQAVYEKHLATLNSDKSEEQGG